MINQVRLDTNSEVVQEIDRMVTSGDIATIKVLHREGLKDRIYFDAVLLLVSGLVASIVVPDLCHTLKLFK